MPEKPDLEKLQQREPLRAPHESPFRVPVFYVVTQDELANMLWYIERLEAELNEDTLKEVRSS